MSSNELQGNVSNGIDRLEGEAMSAIDEGALRAKSAFSGRVDEAVGRARETVRATAQRAQATASTAADQAAETYQLLRGNAQRLASTVDPMVRQQPYMALVAGVIVGLLAGALLFGGGARVI
jgi:ElaB/YqjD/DUF883 family membrane-anchored ribosome-binding protein